MSQKNRINRRYRYFNKIPWFPLVGKSGHGSIIFMGHLWFFPTWFNVCQWHSAQLDDGTFQIKFIKGKKKKKKRNPFSLIRIPRFPDLHIMIHNIDGILSRAMILNRGTKKNRDLTENRIMMPQFAILAFTGRQGRDMIAKSRIFHISIIFASDPELYRHGFLSVKWSGADLLTNDEC